MTLLTRSGKSNIFALSVFLLISFSAGAQVSGYQGKRLYIEYSNYFCPAHFKPNVNGYSGVLSFNTRNSISFDYVIDRQLSMGASYQFLKSKFSYPDWQNYNGGGGYIYTDALGDLTTTAIGLHLRKYTSILAPIGSYYRADIQYLTYQTGYDVDEVWRLQKDKNNPLPNIVNFDKYNGVAVCFGYGNQQVFFSRLIFDYGVQMGLVSLNPTVINIDAGEYDFKVDNYLKMTGKNRLVGHYFFNFYAGLGLLLF